MSQKKWYARWDVIGLLGLLLAAISIGVTFWIEHQNEIAAREAACTDKRSEIAKLTGQRDASQSRLSDLTEQDGSLVASAEQAEQRFRRARDYFDALEAERAIGRISSSFSQAIREFKRDFGASAFDNTPVEVWVDYLEASGYPRQLTERQRLARNLIDWGLESGAGNFMVLTPRDEETTERLIEALGELTGRMASIRDENFFVGAQGIQNPSSHLAELQSRLDALRDQRRSLRTTIEAQRSQLASTESNLRTAREQLSEMTCTQN